MIWALEGVLVTLDFIYLTFIFSRRSENGIQSKLMKRLLQRCNKKNSIAQYFAHFKHCTTNHILTRPFWTNLCSAAVAQPLQAWNVLKQLWQWAILMVNELHKAFFYFSRQKVYNSHIHTLITWRSQISTTNLGFKNPHKKTPSKVKIHIIPPAIYMMLCSCVLHGETQHNYTWKMCEYVMEKCLLTNPLHFLIPSPPFSFHKVWHYSLNSYSCKWFNHILKTTVNGPLQCKLIYDLCVSQNCPSNSLMNELLCKRPPLTLFSLYQIMKTTQLNASVIKWQENVLFSY